MSTPFASVIENLASVLERLVRAHRRLFAAAIVALSLLMWAVAGLVVWLMIGVAGGLPDDIALRGVGSMSRATTVFDSSDAAAFTIYKEQRIEVPLSRISPHVITAIQARSRSSSPDRACSRVRRPSPASSPKLSSPHGSSRSSRRTRSSSSI
jgi:hypothetical protein